MCILCKLQFGWNKEEESADVNVLLYVRCVGGVSE